MMSAGHVSVGDLIVSASSWKGVAPYELVVLLLPMCVREHHVLLFQNMHLSEACVT